MSNRIAITMLVENTANRGGLLAEHGLAVWIEAGGRRILFDTGQGMALRHNAGRLAIDLSTADDVVLSHGHYDHTGGLVAAISSFGQANVYVHPTAFLDRFIQDPRTGVRPVRSPVESLDWLRSRVSRVVGMGSQPVELCPGIWLTGQIPRVNDFEDTGGAFYLDQACTQPDAILDDQALYMETRRGWVVLLGCAHAGVVNTLDYVRTLVSGGRLHAVLGGMHLLHADERRLQQTLRSLRELDVQSIGLAHCTGFDAMARLHHELPKRCFHCVAGTHIAFD